MLAKFIMAVETVKCSVVATLLILIMALDTVHSCAEDRYDEDYITKQRQTLLKLFESALMNDDDALWKLQNIYFNPDSNQSPGQVCLSVTIDVDIILDNCPCTNWNGPAFTSGDCGSLCFNSYYELKLADDVSDTSQLAKLITKSGSTSVFYTIDPSFYSIMKTLSSSIKLSLPYVENDNYYSSDYAHIDITLGTDLDEMPCWDDATYALRSTLMWAKFYARANINGTQKSKEETDRSSVSNGMKLGFYDDDDTEQCQSRAANILIQPQHAWSLVLGIFYFSNLLVLMSTLLNFRKVFLWLHGQNKQIKTLYKASAIVLTCVNIIASISDLYIVVSDSMHNDSNTDNILAFQLPVKVVLVVFILILETPVICFNTHFVNNANQMNTKCQRFAHAFASCQIIWFVHRFINDAFISVIFFVIAPAQTIGIVTLLLSIIASAIAFAAVLIHNFKGCKRQTCKFMTCVILNDFMICGLLVAITLLYIVLVDNGLKSAGMGGLILSLVPPFAVFTIGLIINQKYFKSKEPATSATATPESREPNQTTPNQVNDNEEEYVPLLQVGAHP